jgi:hypothetical protein
MIGVSVEAPLAPVHLINHVSANPAPANHDQVTSAEVAVDPALDQEIDSQKELINLCLSEKQPLM